MLLMLLLLLLIIILAGDDAAASALDVDFDFHLIFLGVMIVRN